MKFGLGQVVITKNAFHTVSEEEVNASLIRYMNGDWGDLDEHDKKLNDKAVESHEHRILGKYKTKNGDIYITTEWNRSYTTIMMTEDY